jgi:methyl-accepting chemotaxis protein
MIIKHPQADKPSHFDEAPLVLGGHEHTAAVRKSRVVHVLLLLVVSLFSILWLASVGLYVNQNIGWPNIFQLLPHEIGAVFAGAFAPLAFLWLLVSYTKRDVESRLKGHALDSLMREMGYPSPEAEARVASLTLTLRRHAKEVQSETETAARRLEAVNAALESQQELSGNISAELLDTTATLQEELDKRFSGIGVLLEKVETQKSRLDAIALDQEQRLNTAVDHAEHSSEAVQVALKNQMDALENAIEKAEEKATQMTHQLEQTSQGIEDVAARSLERAERSSEGVSQQIRAMDETRESVIGAMDKGSVFLKDRTAEIEKVARDTIFELEKVTETLRRGGSDIGIAGDEALSKLNGLRDGMSTASQDMERAMGALSAKQSDFKTEAGEIRNDLHHSTDLLASDAERLAALSGGLTDDISQQSGRLKQEAHGLEDTFKRAEERLSDVEDVLTKAHDLLATASAKSVSDAERFKEHMRGQAEELSTSTEQTAEKTGEIEAQLRKQMNALERASEQVSQMSSEISARLDENVDNLSKASLETSNQILQLGTGFQRQADVLTSTTTKVSSQIREAGEDLRRESQDIEMQGEKASKNIKAASLELERTQKELGATADLSKAKLTAAVEEAVRHHQDFMASAERATQQARQSGESAYSQSAELARTAEKASAQLRTMGDQAFEYVEKLADAAERANREGTDLSNNTKENIEQLAQASTTAAAQFEQLSTLSENARENAQGMEKILRDETVALTEVARQLADRSEFVRSTLEQRAALLHRTSGQADVAGDAFKRKTLELAKASELMLSGLKHADQALERHRREIDTTRHKFQTDLELVTERVSDASLRAREMGDDVAQNFRARATELVKYADEANTGARELTEQFEQQKRRIEVTARQVENSLKETSTILDGESRNLREASTHAAEEALISSLKFQKQADRLKDASQTIHRQVEDIEARHHAVTGEKLRKASALIMDSLHSISIDIARSIDNTLPEDLWNRYRKGEKSIFTRRLLKGKDAEKIRVLYRDNGDFRRYVDQYRTAFDQLLEEAEHSEFSDLLAETYASSDLGKVYFMLSDALGAIH